jgi:hypothetical protein
VEPALAFDLAFVLVLLVVIFATAVKTTLGFGFPLIAVPIAANLIGARTAVVLIAIPVTFSNLLILLRGGGTADEFRQFWSMLAAVIIGTVIGAQFLGIIDPALLSLLLGVTSVAFAVVAFAGGLPTISRRAQTYAGPVVGLVAGVMGGITGIFAPPIAAYVHSLRVEKRTFVFWLTAAFFLGGVSQALSYYRLGLYAGSTALYALVACLPVLAGTQLGFWMQDRLPAETFRRLVLALVFVSGLSLIIRQLL